MTDPNSSSAAKGSVVHRKKPKLPRPLSAMITPSAEFQSSGSTTPSKQGQTPGRNSATDGKQNHSAPRSPARRSLSTPLGRSLSFRISRTKDRRWSDGQTNRLSTYQDDFQSPQILSGRFQGLDLEITGETGEPAAVSPLTTYRDSFQWRSPDRRSAISPDSVAKTSSSPLAASGDGTRLAAKTHITQRSPAVAMVTAKPPANGSEGSRARSPVVLARRSDRCAAQQRTIVSSVNEESSPGSDITSVCATGVSSFQTGKPSGGLRRQVFSNGDILTSSVSCDTNTRPSSTHVSTPNRLRGLQLRSSTGDNAFVYGSNMGS